MEDFKTLEIYSGGTLPEFGKFQYLGADGATIVESFDTKENKFKVNTYVALVRTLDNRIVTKETVVVLDSKETLKKVVGQKDCIITYFLFPGLKNLLKIQNQ
jgi:hypothetical protein